MTINKRPVTFTCDPNAWLGYGNAVKSHYGSNQVSAQLELLIRNETARLSGNLDEYLHGVVRTLRDVASSITNPESKALFTKTVDSLEIWLANARGIQFKATDVQVNYAHLQGKYTSAVKRSDELKKLLKAKECYEDLLDLSVDCGLDMDSDFGNLTEVIDKLLVAAHDPARGLNAEHIQLFISVLEIGKVKRSLEKKMFDIQRKTYQQGKGKTPVPVEAE